MAFGLPSTDDDDLETAVRYGSILLPTFDAAPSSAIDSAHFDPRGQTATFVFRNGGSAEHPCSISEWASYKMSSSRGSAYNQMFRGR